MIKCYFEMYQLPLYPLLVCVKFDDQKNQTSICRIFCKHVYVQACNQWDEKMWLCWKHNLIEQQTEKEKYGRELTKCRAECYVYLLKLKLIQ